MLLLNVVYELIVVSRLAYAGHFAEWGVPPMIQASLPALRSQNSWTPTIVERK